jgi:hypothetical protein
VLLWRKQLTTYDYVLVMRDLKAREEAAAQERDAQRQLAQDNATGGRFCGCCPDVAAIARDVVSRSKFVNALFCDSIVSVLINCILISTWPSNDLWR